jgi:LmbE family N-acetylglucosaminyl deacetylase
MFYSFKHDSPTFASEIDRELNRLASSLVVSDRVFLIVVAHSDDESIGFGGMMQLLAQNGITVIVLIVAINDAVRIEESVAAQEVLDYQHLHVFDFPDGALISKSEQFAATLTRYRETLKQHIIACGSHAMDSHSDHCHLRTETDRLFSGLLIPTFHCKIPQRIASRFHPQAYFRLSDQAMDNKIRALDCYSSEKIRAPEYFDPILYRGLAREAGIHAGTPFEWAESFELSGRLRFTQCECESNLVLAMPPVEHRVVTTDNQDVGENQISETFTRWVLEPANCSCHSLALARDTRY